MLAAGRDRNAAFAVSVSAPLVTASRQMYFAVADELRVNGYSAQDIDAATKTRDAWEGYLRGTRSREDAVRALTAVENKPWFRLTFMPKAKELAATPKESTWRLQMDDDPMRAVGQVSAPLLLIYGGRDPWIPVGTTIALLRERSKNQRNLEYKVIANASHEMSLGKSEERWHSTSRLFWPRPPTLPLTFSSWRPGSQPMPIADRTPPGQNDTGPGEKMGNRLWRSGLPFARPHDPSSWSALDRKVVWLSGSAGDKITPLCE